MIANQKSIELKKIEDGVKYVAPKVLDENDYIVYMQEQTISIVRLVKAAKITCIDVLPRAISDADNGNEEDLINLISEIDHLKSIYSEAINFEIYTCGIVPPELFEELHQYSYGWTKAIVEGMNQFVSGLEFFTNLKKSDFKRGNIKTPETNIVFELNENVNKYNEVMDSITLMMNETS